MLIFKYKKDQCILMPMMTRKEKIKKSKQILIGLIISIPIFTIFIFGYYLPTQAAQYSNPTSIFLVTVIVPILYAGIVIGLVAYAIVLVLNIRKLKKEMI